MHAHTRTHSTGGKSGSVIKCKKCHGIGIQVTHRPLGRGMVQQIQASCGDCAGTGDFVREKDRCKKCKGKRLLDVDTKIEVLLYHINSNVKEMPHAMFSGVFVLPTIGFN